MCVFVCMSVFLHVYRNYNLRFGEALTEGSPWLITFSRGLTEDVVSSWCERERGRGREGAREGASSEGASSQHQQPTPVGRHRKRERAQERLICVPAMAGAREPELRLGSRESLPHSFPIIPFLLYEHTQSHIPASQPICTGQFIPFWPQVGDKNHDRCWNYYYPQWLYGTCECVWEEKMTPESLICWQTTPIPIQPVSNRDLSPLKIVILILWYLNRSELNWESERKVFCLSWNYLFSGYRVCSRSDDRERVADVKQQRQQCVCELYEWHLMGTVGDCSLLVFSCHDSGV